MRVTRTRERNVGQRITLLKEIITKEIDQGKSIRRVAWEHNINECTLGYWIRYWKTGEKGGLINPEKKPRTVKSRKYIRIDKQGYSRRPQSQKPKRFQYVSVHTENKKELECILAAARVIHWAIFLKNVEKEYVKKFEEISGYPLKDDNRANYYRSVTPEGEEVYYFTHSGLEYIFY